VLTTAAVNRIFGTDPLGRTVELFGKFMGQEKGRGIKVDKWIDTYNTLHDDEKTGLDNRNMDYATLVNAYYELATLFYEWGWGQSFHFADNVRHHSFFLLSTANRLPLRAIHCAIFIDSPAGC
jgi:sterol 24-C-methyltransferase